MRVCSRVFEKLLESLDFFVFEERYFKLEIATALLTVYGFVIKEIDERR